jgi:hypothetical protein
MSGKQLDENTIINKLKGSSLFFRPDEVAVHEEPKGDGFTHPVVPSPAAPPSKTTAHLSSSSLPLQTPSQRPTLYSNSATTPTSDASLTQFNPSPPAVPEASEIHGNGDGMIVGPDERRNVRSNERMKVRHSFDILSDQLLALRELAVERERIFGKKVLLGDLVQEALDMFISKERNHE